ncbi:zinc-binding protein A33-like [Betta splendens]|uniref:Zinc-binding protein A33-like n=1 Tax=Betta splendens TaxID=158456 RepID=A0A6P7LG29_BETSP|nr:zinc-binding protein A33-like [Betta splendens]
MNRTLNSTSQTVSNLTPLQLEEQFRCCICLEIYTNPVSIPCGHNACLDCIEDYWDTKNKPDCPLCKEVFPQRPEPRINHTFADIIDILKRSISTPAEGGDAAAAAPPGGWAPRRVQSAEAPACDVCGDGAAAPCVKSCLVCQASYCDLHLWPHLRDPELQRHRLTEPATFPSSHLCRKHGEPLTMFCKNDRAPVCGKCSRREHKQHKVVVMEKESNKVKAIVREKNVHVQKMIQTRLKKIEEIEKSVDLGKKITQREIENSSQVCTLLISTIQRHRAELVQELERRQEEAEERADELLGDLRQEVNALQASDGELQLLEQAQDPLHVLQSFPSLSALPPDRDWAGVAVHADRCVGALRGAVSALVGVCRAAEKQLCAEEANKLNQYAVHVTLDPNTASDWLAVSADGKKVSCQKKRTPLPSSPLRFDSCVCVLGKQRFTSGRRFWVVQVGDKTDWDLGVARESINRKGLITVRPDSGYWAICRRKGGSLSACTGPSTPLHLHETPHKVGIFLDYDEGSVSFYDAEAKTHIYTYSGCGFSGPLCPYFNPCVQDSGKNAAPLVICPVEV